MDEKARAVVISDEARSAASVAYHGARSSDHYESLIAALQAGSTETISELVESLIETFGLFTTLPQAMGRDEYVRGVRSCIDHLRAFQECVERDKRLGA